MKAKPVFYFDRKEALSLLPTAHGEGRIHHVSLPHITARCNIFTTNQQLFPKMPTKLSTASQATSLEAAPTPEPARINP
jgi:hypothetical protein